MLDTLAALTLARPQVSWVLPLLWDRTKACLDKKPEKRGREMKRATHYSSCVRKVSLGYLLLMLQGSNFWKLTVLVKAVQSVYVCGENIENLGNFIYLGCAIHSDGGLFHDVLWWIGLATGIMDSFNSSV